MSKIERKHYVFIIDTRKQNTGRFMLALAFIEMGKQIESHPVGPFSMCEADLSNAEFGYLQEILSEDETQQ